MRYMEDVKEMLCKELEEIAQKGELTAGSLDAIEKLTHSIKSIATVLAMEGYSGEGSNRGQFEGATGPYAGAYDGRSYEGSSYRRGRSATTGRFVSRASGRSYYSRDGMREKLEELMESAPDEHTKQEMQRLIDKM